MWKTLLFVEESRKQYGLPEVQEYEFNEDEVAYRFTILRNEL